ncbi:hypothetical protein OSB04_012443 [Centaurea solstitialis]|uniref:Uncharacterized protein n=1 Tax=Centaurea solstitialis TaxID=347529 RepID=A0AA38TD36_9ASTR|nr:hypothetical protein OSB04_012443 [Centaurea solstitialis]
MEFNFQGWDAQLHHHHHMYPPTTPVKDGLWRETSVGGSYGGGMGILETRKAIERELEKREIAMEMAMHGSPRLPLVSHTNRLQSISFEGGRCEIGGFHQRLVPVDGKKKVIDLGKPHGVKGKPTSEWSCAVCKVSAPCEQAFNAHLVGKKHQAQMAVLKAKNTQNHATQQKTSKKQSGEIGLGVKSITTMETESLKSNNSVKTQPPLLKKSNSSKCVSEKEDDMKNSSKCDSKKEENKKSESWFSCEMCKVRASSHEVMNAHIKGKKHLNNLLKLRQESVAADKKSDSSKRDSKKEEDKKRELWFSCEMCKVGASSHEVMNAHIKGKKHLNNLLRLQESVAADKKSDSSKCDTKKEEDKKSELWFLCEICKVGASSHEVMNAHIKGKKHLNNLLKLRQESVAADKKSDSSNCDSKKGEDKKRELWFSCEMCKVGASSHEVMNAHIKGKKHLNNLLRLHQESVAADKKSDSSNCDSKKEEDKKSELWFSCEICKVGASSHEVMNAHIKGKKHLKNLLKLHQESGLQAAAPGTKKPHKAETEVGVKDKESTRKTQVADNGCLLHVEDNNLAMLGSDSHKS